LALKNVWVKVVGSAYKDSLFTDSLGRFSFLRPISSVNMSSIENLPAKTFLRFSNGNFQWQNQAGKITVEMVSVQGKIVSSFSDNKTSGSFRVPSIATGLYFIRFRSAEQTDVYRYLHLAGNKSSLSAQVEVSPTAGFLAKKTASVACTLSFEKIPYRTILLPLAKAQTGLQIKMQIPANAIYRIYGMNFSPYTGTQNPNTGFVVSEKQIIERMRIIAPYTKVIRTFSATHGQEVCGRIAHLFGLKIYVNAWIGPDSVANNKEMDSLIAMAKRGEVDTAIVGSEALLRGDITEAKLIALINRFRTAVPNVPVTTADVYGQLIGHPNVIAACDFVFANFYPYWEGVKIDYAVASLYDSYQNLVKVSGSKEVIISEAGWPSAGATFAESVPSPENAAFYLLNFVSWARATNVKIFSFEAFDEPWKTSEGTVGANWGIFDKDGVMKPRMQKVFDGDTMANNWTGGDTVDGPGTPTITFTFVPAIGSAENLRGKVSHVVPKNYGIAVYIKVAGGWWQKPTYAQPVTKINIDGTWVCDFTTGGNDASATEITAFLIPIDYAPPTSYSAVAADKIVAKLNVVR
jgi:exo-beta-1,3-glucanase (GH17 family)